MRGRCVDLLISDDENSNGEAFVVLTTLKVFRLLRITRLMRLVSGLRQLIATMVRSAEQIFYLFSILMLLVVIFALLGMEAFAKPLNHPEWEKSLYRYNDFPAAVTTILVILSGENWNEVLYQGWGAIGPVAFIYYAMVRS